jgi:hypothetical protein
MTATQTPGCGFDHSSRQTSGLKANFKGGWTSKWFSASATKVARRFWRPAQRALKQLSKALGSGVVGVAGAAVGCAAAGAFCTFLVCFLVEAFASDGRAGRGPTSGGGSVT